MRWTEPALPRLEHRALKECAGQSRLCRGWSIGPSKNVLDRAGSAEAGASCSQRMCWTEPALPRLEHRAVKECAGQSRLCRGWSIGPSKNVLDRAGSAEAGASGSQRMRRTEPALPRLEHRAVKECAGQSRLCRGWSIGPSKNVLDRAGSAEAGASGRQRMCWTEPALPRLKHRALKECAGQSRLCRGWSIGPSKNVLDRAGSAEAGASCSQRMRRTEPALEDAPDFP
ncbi:hypothetical protein NDU88_002729 [Pleurodeles waltl]|uniref:Uncharacterized protein n=1 Tax=Pleurodeles waltl TaxID=8319 RepID=A0AAV7UY68_PLEWA|nr:hypothetical protein NDU88_002729 [Pleurodeles waltl]